MKKIFVLTVAIVQGCSVDTESSETSQIECNCSIECEQEGKCSYHDNCKCYASSDDDCYQSDGCYYHGKCSLSPGGNECALLDLQDCAESGFCEECGRCDPNNANTLCIAVDNSCLSSYMCSEYGSCGIKEGQFWCSILSQEHCEQSNVCENSGLCTFQEIDGSGYCCNETGFCMQGANPDSYDGSKCGF